MMKTEQVKLIEKLRNQGASWREIGKEFSEEFNDPVTGNAVRKRYEHHIDKFGEATSSEDMKKIVRAQLSAKSARNEKKKALESQIVLDDILTELKKVPKKLLKVKATKPKKPAKVKGKMTVEANFSDLQIGKVMDDFDSNVAVKRVQEYTQSLLQKIKMHENSGYVIEAIHMNVLGDLIECSEKHYNSQRATDSSTPEQMRGFVECFYKDVMLPISAAGYKTIYHCVTGNHENPMGGLNMFYPGREHLSWTMYNYLKLLAEASGMTNVLFDIAEGAFLHYDIYGKTMVCEHGVKIGANEASMAGKVNMRSRQIKKHVSYFRMGDKHHVARFNNDAYVVNGAFFGADERGVEYSGIVGYYAPAAQVVFFHVPRKKDDPRTTIYDSFVIQLQHIK